jgi:hypothetical protein
VRNGILTFVTLSLVSKLGHGDILFTLGGHTEQKTMRQKGEASALPKFFVSQSEMPENIRQSLLPSKNPPINLLGCLMFQLKRITGFTNWDRKHSK